MHNIKGTLDLIIKSCTNNTFFFFYLFLDSDPQCGEGIYFAKNVKKAMDVWRENNDQYLYFVEADVLTGKSIKGKPGLILPPAVGKDPQVRFDSVNGGSDISVIFSSYQALPRYIITCRNLK